MEEMKENLRYELSKIRCLKCGSTIGPHSMDGRRYYRCRGYNKNKKCSSKAIKADILETVVQLTLINYAKYLENLPKEDFTIMLKRCNQNIIETEEKLKKLQEERGDFLKNFFEDLADRNTLDYKDKYIIAKYRDVAREKNLLLFNLEQLETSLLSMLETLQEKSQKGTSSPFLEEKDCIDFLNLTAFNKASKEKGLYQNEERKLYTVYLDISEGIGKIHLINPLFYSYEDIPFRIDPKDMTFSEPKKIRKTNSG